MLLAQGVGRALRGKRAFLHPPPEPNATKDWGLTLSCLLRPSAAVLKHVEADLNGVRAAVAAEPSLQEFLTNAGLSPKAKSAGIDEMLKIASPKTGPSEITKNFFEVLAENGRLYESEKVIADFLEIMSAHRGEVNVTITTAQPLEKDLQKRLEESLKGSALAGAGKTLLIVNKVNPAVLGGLVVDFGDKTVDLSVASRVNKLNAALQGASSSSFLDTLA